METALSDEDRAVLELEDQRWKYAGAKDSAIRDRFGISATAYYQRLNAILDQPAAEAALPQLVRRLRRVREARQRARRGKER